jgi:hypothetical protein
MDSVRGLTTTLAIPGLPEWTGLLILIVGLLCAAAFLMMPFSVFGVKARLEALEVQLDEIQAEIRSLALRLGEPDLPRRAPLTEDWVEPPATYAAGLHRDQAPRVTPPVPPPPAWPDRASNRPPSFRSEPSRSEPKLDWPRNRP